MKKTNELIEKAEKVMQDYNHATGCSYCFYDSDYNLHISSGQATIPEKDICPYCPKFKADKARPVEEAPSAGVAHSSRDTQSEGRVHAPCHEIHINAIKEANKKGSYRIYSCDLGLQFWTSPIYTQGSFSGAIRGGVFLQNTQKAVDIFSNANDNFVMRNDEKNKEELKERIAAVPGADGEKIQSLAEMMQLCAESLSTGSEDYQEVIRRRAEQQQTIAKIIDSLKKQYGNNPQLSQNEKPGYPLDKEKTLMAALRKGDAMEAKKTLNELLAMVIYTNEDRFDYIQLRVTELVVMISRVEVSPAKSGNLSMEINSQNLKMVQEAKTIEELTDIIHTAVDRVSGNISSFRGIPHAAALRKAEIFILENYTRKISLKEIADVAGLSPPYFSTIFKEEMGENLSKYLNRLRVERASRYLLETDMSLSEIAACCCFEDQSWFSKIFKAYTGISPGKYRNQGGTR